MGPVGGPAPEDGDSPARAEKAGLILIVDDDEAVARTVSMILEGAGYGVEFFQDGDAFLGAARERAPVALLVDVFMPNKSGLDLLRELPAQDYRAPVLMISGRGEIALAIEAIKIGAFDFIEKPFRGAVLVEKVRAAIEAFAPRQAQPGARGPGGSASANIEILTRREQEVLAEIVAGNTSKQAARTLGLSPRTLEEHRANMMRKLGAKNTADLIRLTLADRDGGRR